MSSAINWFEIPAADFARAKKFYSTIMDGELPEMEMGGFMMAFFPADNTGVGGAIVSGEGCVPSDKGSLIYLNGGDDLNTVLSRVEDAGGKVIMPKTAIGNDYGYCAIFTDSEGNRMGLHSMS